MKESAFVYNPNLEKVSRRAGEAVAATSAFLDLVGQRLMRAEAVTAWTEGWLPDGHAGHRQVFQLYDTQLKTLDHLLELGIQRFNSDVYIRRHDRLRHPGGAAQRSDFARGWRQIMAITRPWRASIAATMRDAHRSWP